MRGDVARMTEAITIDVWSDVACPWCYIGKRRLESGISLFQESGGHAPEITVTYHSFELAPDAPLDSAENEEEFLAVSKGLDREQVRAMFQQVSAVASSVGLTYDFDHVTHANTRRAHELIHFAAAHDKHHEMVEKLFAAHFVEDRHVGLISELADLAADLGLDREEVVAALEREEYSAAVREDEERAGELGITGVPFFVIDGRYGVSGAQEPSTFARALETVLAERESVSS